LANPRKQIWFGLKQPLVGEKRCVTTQITAAEETTLACTRIDFRERGLESGRRRNQNDCNNKLSEETRYPPSYRGNTQRSRDETVDKQLRQNFGANLRENDNSPTMFIDQGKG